MRVLTTSVLWRSGGRHFCNSKEGQLGWDMEDTELTHTGHEGSRFHAEEQHTPKESQKDEAWMCVRGTARHEVESTVWPCREQGQSRGIGTKKKRKGTHAAGVQEPGQRRAAAPLKDAVAARSILRLCVSLRPCTRVKPWESSHPRQPGTPEDCCVWVGKSRLAPSLSPGSLRRVGYSAASSLLSTHSEYRGSISFTQHSQHSGCFLTENPRVKSCCA